MKLLGRKVLITGGSMGLGRAIAEHYLIEGADVVICARGSADLATTWLDFVDRFPTRKILAKICDVSDESQVKDLVDFTLRELGGLDVLILNAGILGPLGPTESVDLAEWRKTIDINLFGVLHGARATMPHFKRQQHGKIIILSGGGATNPMFNISAYAASKAAVVRLMETLALELKPYGVDVNAIAPGALHTRIMEAVVAAGPEAVGRAYYEKNKQWVENGATPLSLGAELAVYLGVYLGTPESQGITGKLISAQWDPWSRLHLYREELSNSDIYCLRRIVPEDRDKNFDQ